MKFFLDTADPEIIKNWSELCIIDGVTTNPSHLAKQGGDPRKIIDEIITLLPDAPISVEVTETDSYRVYDQAHKIARIAPNVVVKIPCHKNYYAIIKKLVDEGVAINVTLIFTVFQALCMGKLGVHYISPFIGRLDDIDSDGISIINQLRTILDTYNFTHTQLLAASMRSVRDIHYAALAGADIVTISADILEKAIEHPLTDQGMQKFIDDWQKLGIKQFP